MNMLEFCSFPAKKTIPRIACCLLTCKESRCAIFMRIEVANSKALSLLSPSSSLFISLLLCLILRICVNRTKTKAHHVGADIVRPSCVHYYYYCEHACCTSDSSTKYATSVHEEKSKYCFVRGCLVTYLCSQARSSIAPTAKRKPPPCYSYGAINNVQTRARCRRVFFTMMRPWDYYLRRDCVGEISPLIHEHVRRTRKYEHSMSTWSYMTLNTFLLSRSWATTTSK